MSENDQDDRETMALLAAGEDQALNALMDRWKHRVIAYLYRFTGNETVAADLAEETFVRVYQGRLRFRKGSSFSTWLFGIAANLARNHLRWQRRHPTFPLDLASDATSGEDPLKTEQSRERAEAVRKAIATLSPDLREALILSEYEDLGQKEIAAVSGCSVKAIERRLSRARDLLSKELSRYLTD